MQRITALKKQFIEGMTVGSTKADPTALCAFVPADFPR